MSATLLLAGTGFGPKGDGAKVTKEQLEYSKQMFGEGEAAMEAGDYATALAKYKEGYRYAPHLHIFTFNIASAADSMDDCRTAMTYFQMFVDLVPKHPSLKEANKRLAELKESCQVDSETVDLGPAKDDETPDAGGGGRGKESREERESRRIMNEALRELKTATIRYERSKALHPKVAAFGRALRKKKKHHKRLLKLAKEEGVKLEQAETPDVQVGSSPKQACGEAESQEKRIINAMEAVLERYESDKMYRLGNKIRNRAERRDKLAFDACS